MRNITGKRPRTWNSSFLVGNPDVDDDANLVRLLTFKMVKVDALPMPGLVSPNLTRLKNRFIGIGQHGVAGFLIATRLRQ